VPFRHFSISCFKHARSLVTLIYDQTVIASTLKRLHISRFQAFNYCRVQCKLWGNYYASFVNYSKDTIIINVNLHWCIHRAKNKYINKRNFCSGPFRTTPEKIFERAALFLRLGLPFTLIRHENGAYGKRSSNRRNLNSSALRFSVDGNILKTKLFINNAITMIKWFPWPRFPQTHFQNDRRLLRSAKFLRHSVEGKHLMCFQTENAIFKFFRRSSVTAAFISSYGWFIIISFINSILKSIAELQRMHPEIMPSL